MSFAFDFNVMTMWDYITRLKMHIHHVDTNQNIRQNQNSLGWVYNLLHWSPTDFSCFTTNTSFDFGPSTVWVILPQFACTFFFLFYFLTRMMKKMERNFYNKVWVLRFKGKWWMSFVVCGGWWLWLWPKSNEMVMAE